MRGNINVKEQKNMATSNEDTLMHTSEHYLALPYKRIIYPTGDSGGTAFFAEVLELEGCCAEGTTYTEAYEALTQEMRRHIQMYLNKKIAPPTPRLPKDYSGRVLVRMPASLQYKLALRAKEENVSVNQLIVSKLSSGESIVIN
jgi:predicted HicB family RNase H-like nuclease